jgi:hypothetical protein
MKRQRPKLKFQIDIVDFKNDLEIIDTIKNLLKLTRDKNFIENIDWDSGEEVDVKVSPNISFVISGCNCD